MTQSSARPGEGESEHAEKRLDEPEALTRRSTVGFALASLALTVTCLGLETLYFVAQNSWFLSDLGSAAAQVLATYAAVWLGTTVLASVVSQNVRLRFALTAAVFYFAISIKILGSDSSFLLQPWGLGCFLSSTLVLGAIAFVLQRRTGSELVWFVGVIGYQAALLALADAWAKRGGNLIAFLLAPPFVLALLVVSCLTLLAGYVLVSYKRSRVSFAVAAALLPFAASLLSSRSARDAVATSGAAEGPDIYVFSVDALRKDTFDEWCEHGAPDLTAIVCRDATRHDAVVTDGISTYQVLVRNLALQGDCAVSLPGRLRRTHLTSMYLGRRGKRITGSACFDRYFSGTGSVLGNNFVVPGLLEKFSDPEAGELRAKYVPTEEMVARFAREEGRAARPLFSYFHILDMHGPYVPSSLATDPHHLADVREFQQFCYWGNCELEDPHNRALVNGMRAAYLATLTDVEHHLRAFLSVVRARNRPFVLVFTADHGELFGEHGAINHSGGFVQELLSVPFSVYDSRVAGAERRDCTLELSSEALHRVLGIAGQETKGPSGRRSLSARPLGKATIDAAGGKIEFEIDPAMRELSGTWRNVHTTVTGSTPWQNSRCAPSP